MGKGGRESKKLTPSDKEVKKQAVYDSDSMEMVKKSQRSSEPEDRAAGSSTPWSGGWT